MVVLAADEADKVSNYCLVHHRPFERIALVFSNPLRHITWCLECFKSGSKYTVVQMNALPQEPQSATQKPEGA